MCIKVKRKGVHKNGKEAKIDHAIMDADVFISLNHFKGHEMTGFGGAIKNIGMGCGSRAGKKDQHNNGTPKLKRLSAVAAGDVSGNVPTRAMMETEMEEHLGYEKSEHSGTDD